MGCCDARKIVSPSSFTNDRKPEPTRKQSGIAKLRLIDFDQVTLSSLNRHATATRADVGIPKVRSVQQFLHSVVPWVNIDACTDLWNIEAEQSNHWLEGADWVVDAIDNISTKVRKINDLICGPISLDTCSLLP